MSSARSRWGLRLAPVSTEMPESQLLGYALCGTDCAHFVVFGLLEFAQPCYFRWDAFPQLHLAQSVTGVAPSVFLWQRRSAARQPLPPKDPVVYRLIWHCS